MSPKYLPQHVQELEGRYDARESDTIEHTGGTVVAIEGKWLAYGALVADNDLPSAARAT